MNEKIIDEAIILNEISTKTILVTGGTGSFGQKFTEILLKKYSPRAIRIFSRDEKKQYDMKNKFNDDRLRFFIGDIRDQKRLYRAMNGVDVVVHAAALKQVPSCEYNPIEAVKTNVDGTINVIDASIDQGVSKVVGISTDKAVHPVNLYGATKMTAEKLLIQANSYTGGVNTKFACVRYGNVIGSRGSVIPLFKKQKEGGVLTITDENMTRFWLTIGEGVEFVLNSISQMNGGEVFVPKIPSMKIIDLANAIAPDAKKKIVGIRPGEKIHETLLTVDESRHSKALKKFFVIEPEHAFWDGSNYDHGVLPQPDFCYSSDNNDQWIAAEEIRKIIELE